MKFVYRDFPVVGGAPAAEASECAHEQNAFWEYHNGLFDNVGAYNTADDFVALADSLGLDTDTFRECVETNKYREEVINDYNDGRAYGISGTPTFFINGVRLIGAQPFAEFKKIIDEELGQ